MKSISFNYNIKNIDKYMSRNALINAIGRCKDYKQIHLNHTNKYFEWENPREVIIDQKIKNQIECFQFF